MYKILEDNSPYFIKFYLNGIDNVVSECQHILNNIPRTGNFQHHKLDIETGIKVIKMLPFSMHFPINLYRLSLFITPPKYQHYAHIDGDDNTISLNLGIKIQNNLCKTNWYDKDVIYKNYKTISNLPYDFLRTESVIDNKKNLAASTATLGQNEFILHNSTIFHDWDNSQSDQERIVLTVRPSKKIDPVSFDQAKILMFDLKK